MDGRLDAVACSINRPNLVSFVDQPAEMRVCDDPHWPVFISRQKYQSLGLSMLLANRNFHSAVSHVVRSEKDSVHIFKDGIIVYFHPDSPKALQQAIESLCGLVGPRTRISSRSLSTLPDNLVPLIPLIKKWAEGDDRWRAEMLSRARKSDVETLVVSVEPFLGQINDYLDKCDDDAALALGRLAELVVEAQIQLRSQKN
jgi:hypothetical protein